MKNSPQTDRRDFLKTSLQGSLALGAGVVALEALAGTTARAADAAADMAAVSKPGMPKPVPTQELFRLGVIGPAELSLATSKIAVDKATNANAKEFAGFELTEAIAVTTVLTDLGTPVPEPDDKAKMLLDKLNAASGTEFDKAYIAAQLENHEFLRDHARDFLKNGADNHDAPTSEGKHLATLALVTFKEHVAICARIKKELMA